MRTKASFMGRLLRSNMLLLTRNVFLGVVVCSWVFFGLAVSTAQAVSCGCFKENSSANVRLAFDDGSTCKVGISADQCVAGAPNLKINQNQINCYGEFNESCDEVVCTAYRDDGCTEAVGGLTASNISSVINRCWTQKQCEGDGRGTWDKTAKECGSLVPVGDPNYEKFKTGRCYVVNAPQALQVAIPGLGKKCTNNIKESCNSDSECGTGKCRQIITGGFPEYLAGFYKFFVAALAVMAVTMISWGGFKRLMAAGSSERVKDANDVIFQAIIGLTLALISYSLLSLINPKLVDSTGLHIDRVKTEIFGNWCPDKDPLDEKITYQCGDQAVINGQTCTGRYCAPGSGGCYKIDATGDKLPSGKSEDYECLQPQQACDKIDDDNVAGIHGAGEKNDVHMAACKTYSDQNGQCLWVEYGGFVAPLAKDDQCDYFPNELIEKFCNGGTYNGKTYTRKQTCDDFNDTLGAFPYDELTGIDWPFCYLNLCKKYNSNLNCYAEWRGWSSGAWICKP